MKLNPKQLKNVDYKKLALQHGEKAAMVVCGAILIWGIYSFFDAEGSEVSPTELRDKVARAEEHLQSTQPPEVSVEGPFAALAEQRLEDPIPVTAVAWTGPLWQPVKSRGQREEPEYLAAVDPVVDADHVTVPIKAPAGAGIGRIQRVERDDDDDDQDAQPAQAPIRNVKAYPYASVRYLVPLKKQIEAYRNARLGATMPFYYEFVLERQYLLPDGDWSDWEPVNLDLYLKERDDWATLAGAVVPPSATDLALTAPLPARINGDWTQDGGHPKLAVVEEFFLPPEEQPEEQPKPKTTAGGKGGFARRPAGTSQPTSQGRAFGPSQIRRSPLAQQSGGPADPSQTGDSTGSGQFQGQQGQFSQQQPNPPRPQPAQRAPAQQAAAAPGEQSEYLLFRYLDLDVEPGQSYRYRVKLVLRNPNFEVEHKLLKDGNKALAEGQFRETDWSRPTPMVTVPDNLRYAVYRGDVDDDAVEIHLFYVDPELGSMAAESSAKNPRPLNADFKRGDVIAVTNESGWLVNMETNRKVRRKDINATSGDTLIDFFGGRESLDLGDGFPADIGDVNIPYTALVLDSHGEWVTRRQEAGWHELNSRLVAEHNAAQEEKDEEPATFGGQFQGQGQFGQGQGQFGPQGGP